MLTKVLINSVDVTDKCVRWEYEHVYGDALSEISINFVRTINDVISLSVGDTLELWRGTITSTDEKIFNGYIEKFEPESGLIVVTGIDKLWDAVRKEVTHVYDSTVDSSAGKISAIFQDLITTYTGLNADATTIQDSGTTYLINKFVCNHTDPFERCKALADILNWQFYYRSDTDKVYFEPKGFSANAYSLLIGSNVINIPKWNYDITEMCNNLTVVGAYQEIETTLSGQIGVTSGFTTTGISLTYEPISVKVYGSASNPPTTLKVGGMPDSTTTFDYYVDKNKRMIYPKASTTFTSNDYYEIRYSLAAPIPVNMYNQSSIDTFGLFQKTITYNDLRSVADAESRGTNYLLQYSQPFVYSTLRIMDAINLNLRVGQSITVVDNISIPAVNTVMVINRVRMRWPNDYDEVDVGDKYWRLADFQTNIMEKLKRYEEDEFANLDIINDLVTADTTLNDPIKPQPRYYKVITQTINGNGFILGHPTDGVLGTSKLGDDFDAEVLSQLYQYNNIYEEEFLDADFLNGASTATIDYTNNRVVF